jgi:plasmid replication initiation protein
MKAEQGALFDLERSRVTQANALARAVQKMDLLEKQLLALAISRLRWGQDDFTTIQMPMSDIRRILGRNNKNIYKLVQIAASGLLKRTVLIEDKGGGWTEFQWLSEAKYIPARQRADKMSVIQLKLHDNLRQFLLQLKGNYAAIPIQELIYISSFRSLRLFEILYHDSQRGKRAVITYELADLRHRLAIEDKQYQSFKDFRYVLEKCQEDMLEHTSLSMTFRGIKHGQHIRDVQFTVVPNVKYQGATVSESLVSVVELDAEEETLVKVMQDSGFRQDARKTIAEFGFERVKANVHLARTSMAEGAAAGNPIKSPGGLIYDFIRRDVAHYGNPKAVTKSVDIDAVARQLSDLFYQECKGYLAALWERMDDDEKVEVHELMRTSFNRHTLQLLEQGNWCDDYYEVKRNKLLFTLHQHTLPDDLATLEAYIAERALLSEYSAKTRQAILSKVDEYL